MSDEPYKLLLGDVIEELVERTKDRDLYAQDQFSKGYKQALYTSLSLLQMQLRAFGLDGRSVGFGDFDADDWFRLGDEYWKARGLWE